MRYKNRIMLIIFGILFFTTVASAQERGNDEARVSPNATVSQTIGTTIVSITYGRPGIKGREIFGQLVPYDKVWRAGANESTVITFSKDIEIEGKSLKAGTYSLYTIPGKNQWTVIINSKLSWGTQYDESKDVLRVQVQPRQGDKAKQFIIYFEDVTDHSARAVLHWDTTEVPFTIEA